MKKKPLTTYPNIPLPKIDQFTLPELINQLFRNKQFTTEIQKLLSNCILTKSSPQQKITNQTYNPNKPYLTSPTSSSKTNTKQTFLSNSTQNTFSSIIPLNSEDQCEFIFQNQVRNRMIHPWNLDQNGKEEVVQCKLITDQITDFIQDTIQCSLHKILNKQFISVTNQILAMREEINLFTKQELQRTDSLKTQVNRQLQKMQKKLLQQQHISNSLITQPLEKFARSKGMLNGSLSKNPNKQSIKLQEDNQKSVSVHHDLFALRKQVETIRNSLSSNSQPQKPVNFEIVKQMEQKLFNNQQKLNQLTLTLKLSLEEHKQKWKKSHEKLCSQLATNTSKQYIAKQVKKVVQSNLKIYLDEIMKCKRSIQDIYDRMQKNDKGMQDYIGNQLKNVWTLVSGIKTRVENIEDQFNVGMDQSFVL